MLDVWQVVCVVRNMRSGTKRIYEICPESRFSKCVTYASSCDDELKKEQIKVLTEPNEKHFFVKIYALKFGHFNFFFLRNILLTFFAKFSNSASRFHLRALNLGLRVILTIVIVGNITSIQEGNKSLMFFLSNVGHSLASQDMIVVFLPFLGETKSSTYSIRSVEAGSVHP